MRHRNLSLDSVLVHTGYMGTGALLLPNPIHRHWRVFAAISVLGVLRSGKP